MNISLMIPCYVDQLMPQIGISMVKVFERLGHTVMYPEGQTCCGQASYNAGFFDEARPVALHTMNCFSDSEVVVVPSGSCASMMRNAYRELFKDSPHAEEAQALCDKTYEFSEFLVKKLDVRDVQARFPHRVTFHDGCHGLRELGLQFEARELLNHVEGLELVEMEEAKTCCGFGGSFAVKFPKISTAMAEVKCNSITETAAEYVVSNDPSCLMQIAGYLSKQGSPVKGLHVSEVLVQS